MRGTLFRPDGYSSPTGPVSTGVSRATRVVCTSVCALLLLVVPAGSACAGYFSKTVVLSRLADGRTASGGSRLVSMSGDGRYVAFQSDAADLAPGSGPFTDVFVRDTVTGDTVCASRGYDGRVADGPSTSPAISADGRWVAYESAASDIVAGDTNGAHDVFVYDRLTGTNRLVSVSVSGGVGDADSFTPAIDDDGSKIAFVSSADNLVYGDTAGRDDVFVRDLQAGGTVRVSVGVAGEADGESSGASISGDGGVVAFVSSASNIVAGDTNGQPDVFAIGSNATGAVRVSVATGGGQVSLGSYAPSVSQTGRWVAFESLSGSLVAGDTNGVRDIFVRDIAANSTMRVSTSSAGAQADGESRQARISPDGSRVAFVSAATNLYGADANGASDVFLKVPATGSITRISNAANGAAASGASVDAAICATPGWVAFSSEAPDIAAGDVNGVSDVFMSRYGTRLYDRVAGRDRYATAVEASRRAFPNGTSVAVVATGRNWPDALGGSALAGVAGGPLLLTDSAALSAITRDEIRRLGVKKVYVLGGTSSVSAKTQSEIGSIVGAANVQRLGGANRYATGTSIADEVLRLQGAAYGGTALVCTGGNFPDALAGSPMAAKFGMPIVLANPVNRGYALPAGTRRVVILGGPASVSPVVEQQLRSRLGAANVTRLGGSDRYEASANIARWSVANVGLTYDDVTIATGEKFADALSGGVMAARMNGVILLCQLTRLPASPAAVLSASAPAVERVRIVGGEMSVGPVVVSAVKRSLGD